MMELSNTELELISELDVVREDVVRPISRKPKTIKEKINEAFADTVCEMTSYSCSKDATMRDMFETSYNWHKTENDDIITEVMTSYCPISMTNEDISSLVTNSKF